MLVNDLYTLDLNEHLHKMYVGMIAQLMGLTLIWPNAGCALNPFMGPFRKILMLICAGMNIYAACILTPAGIMLYTVTGGLTATFLSS